jgi:hypothetical protein
MREREPSPRSQGMPSKFAFRRIGQIVNTAFRLSDQLTGDSPPKYVQAQIEIMNGESISLRN